MTKEELAAIRARCEAAQRGDHAKGLRLIDDVPALLAEVERLTDELEDRPIRDSLDGCMRNADVVELVRRELARRAEEDD